MNRTKKWALSQLILNVVVILGLIALILVVKLAPYLPNWLIILFAIGVVTNSALGIYQIIYCYINSSLKSLIPKGSNPVSFLSAISSLLGLVFVSCILNIIILCKSTNWSESNSS